jgi:hypothetical protein
LDLTKPCLIQGEGRVDPPPMRKTLYFVDLFLSLKSLILDDT